MKTINALALTGAVLLAALWSAPRVVAKPVDRPLVVAQAEKKKDTKPQRATKQQTQKAKKPQVKKKPAAARAKPKPQAKPKAVQTKPKPARKPTAQAKPRPAPAKPKAAQVKTIDASAQAQAQERQKPDAAKQDSNERRIQKREDRIQRNQDRKPAAAQQEKKAPQKPAAAQQQKKDEPQTPAAVQQQKKDEPQKPAARQQQKKDEPQKPAARQQNDSKSATEKATNPNNQKSLAPDQRQRNAAPSDRDRDNTRSRPATGNDHDRNRADQDRDRDRNRADQDRDRDRNARDRGDNDRDRANRDRDSAAAERQPIKPRSADEFIRRAGETQRRGIDDVRRERRETREGNRIIIHEGDRRIVKQDNRVIIRHREAERFAIGARNVDVRRQGNEITTVVMRPNGMRIINVTDDDGHLIRRVRRDSRGREVVIIDNRYRGRRPDIFIDVPPPRFHGHRDRYIVEAWRVPPPRIYEVFTAPPIMPLDRRYTLAQVRYSEPLREYMPRVDLEINFESGSWQITPDQIAELSAIADGLNKAIDQNPDEVFLIEGYTDAVGSDEDNLSLSDRRAEAVAVALTQEFNVPPENLVTQGYGEEHLKVETEGPNRANRRVSIRRITPLLDKVAGQ